MTPGHAGGGLGVADVGLHRAEPQRLVRAVLAVGGEQRLRLDRVAERGAGAVRLHRVDVGGREPGVGQRLPDDPLLGGAVRRGQPVGGAVLVDRASRGSRRAPGARCARRRTAAPAAARRRPRPSRCRRPRAANALHRPSAARPRCREKPTNDRRGGHHRDAAGQRQRALAGAQRLAARCSATSDDEQAVSTVTAGPSRPSV